MSSSGSGSDLPKRRAWLTLQALHSRRHRLLGGRLALRRFKRFRGRQVRRWVRAGPWQTSQDCAGGSSW